MSPDLPIIAVVGATGLQGGGVVRALQAQGRFRVRALTRNPDKHAGLADEVVHADLADPATLRAAFKGAYGAFVVTNSWEGGGGQIDEAAQGRAAVEAARAADVKHFIWSTLPDVDAITHGKLHVPHFTDKAAVDAAVRDAGFVYHTFVMAPFYYQNLSGVMAPRPLGDGTTGWALPIDPSLRCIHMGDITELGAVVAAAFTHPERVGHGEHLALSGGLHSFDDVVRTVNAAGHRHTFKHTPREVYATFYPGADEMAQMLAWFEQFTYMGPEADARIALAREITPAPTTDLETWVKQHLPGDAGRSPVP
jgi:uncharacterized protein YbjT (DUF2867 family)